MIRPETTAWRAYSERVRLQAAALRCTRRYSASLTRKRTPRSSAGVHPWVSLPPWRGGVGGGTSNRELFRAAYVVYRKRRPVPRIRGEPSERRMVRRATLGSRPGGAAPQGEEVQGGSQKPDVGFLCHENTTSLLSVFGPGSRQHVRRLKSNGAESRGRKVVSAEALPYRQTAGGSCRGKDGERAAFGPNGSGHVVVQPGTVGNGWKTVGSSEGSLGGNEWRCHGRWFLRRCEDNGTRRRFVSPWGAIARSCR